MRRDSHIPYSERTGTKQELATRHDKEAECTPQGLAFGPNKTGRIGESSEMIDRRTKQCFLYKRIKRMFNMILE